MTPPKDIIGIVKELEAKIIDHVDNDRGPECATLLSLEIAQHLPAIAQALLIAMDGLENMTYVDAQTAEVHCNSCNQIEGDCMPHCYRYVALSQIRSL